MSKLRELTKDRPFLRAVVEGMVMPFVMLYLIAWSICHPVLWWSEAKRQLRAALSALKD
jgi:hypothetical protein